ncbi:YqkE family protein [Bacillus massilinigeriensis]|uniref:YqkE family protein n=1 Tax=Bacillus massilionigeriensis TaxID=1805475 RepID=UPI00096B1E57|nr:YqkE family protein [Bacillus massilionigeriensis]
MKKHQAKPKQKTDDKPLTLGDLLNKELVNQLKETKTQLKVEEDRKKELEEERKREARRQKEKNKSFEELLNESELNWKEYK